MKISKNYDELKKSVIENGGFVEISKELYYNALGSAPPIYHLNLGFWQMGEECSNGLFYTFYKKDNKFWGCLCNLNFAIKETEKFWQI